MFLGLAIGLLAKGPIALVLAGIPMAVWTLRAGYLMRVLRTIHWVRGLLVTCALVVPWYAWAEWRTPGFLEYFLVGEHWKRFTQPGWTGDLYGAAHARPRGMISIYGLAWRAVVAGRGRLVRWGSRATPRLAHLLDDPWRAYFLLWAITPMLFFTVSGNVLPTYVLPGLPAFALLFATVWRPLAEDAVAVRSTVRHVLVTGVVICIAFVVAIGVLRGRMENELSHKALARTVAAQRSGTDQRLVYMTQQPVSALFYSQGAATKVADAAALAPSVATTASSTCCASATSRRCPRRSVRGWRRSELGNPGCSRGSTLMSRRAAMLAFVGVVLGASQSALGQETASPKNSIPCT